MNDTLSTQLRDPETGKLPERQLRHWFGTMVQRQSGDIRVTQELLGHASPSTTAGYAAFSMEHGATAVAGLPVALRRAA